MRLLYIHLAATIAGVLAAATASTFPGRSKRIVVVVAAVCAMLNAGAVGTKLVTAPAGAATTPAAVATARLQSPSSTVAPDIATRSASIMATRTARPPATPAARIATAAPALLIFAVVLLLLTALVLVVAWWDRRADAPG